MKTIVRAACILAIFSSVVQANWPLRQSTASQIVQIGPFLSTTDGNTEMTALTIANTDIQLQKGYVSTRTTKNSGGATHISNAVYYMTLDATDTATVGPLVITVHVSTALACQKQCFVYPANMYDWITGAGATMPASGVIGTGTSTLTAAQAATAVWQDTTAGDLNVTSSIGKSLYTSGNAPGAASGLAIVGSNMGTASSVTGDVGGKVLGGGAGTITGTGVRAVDGSGNAIMPAASYAAAPTAAQNRAEMDSNSTKLANLDAAITSRAAAATALSTATWTSGKAAYLDGAISGIPAAMWDVTLSGHLTSGTTGAALNAAGSAGDPWSTALSTYGAGTAGKLVYDGFTTNVPAIKTKTDPMTYTATNFLQTDTAYWKGATAPAMTGDAYARMGTTGSGLTSLAPASTALSNAVWTDSKAGYLTGDAYARIGATGSGLTSLAPAATALSNATWTDVKAGYLTGTIPTSGTIAAAVWNEPKSSHTTAATFGYYLDTAVSGVQTGGLTAGTIAAAVVDQALSGHTTSGTVGKSLSDAGAAGNPWASALTDNNTGGTFGYLLNHNLDGQVSYANSSLDTLSNLITGIMGTTWTSSDTLQYISHTVGLIYNTGTVGMGTTIPSSPTAGTFGSALKKVTDYLDAPISGVGGATGAGAATTELTIEWPTGTPVADAAVWVTTDSAGKTVVAGTLRTNAFGKVTFLLDAGTYYRWAKKTGVNFSNPKVFTVSAP
jgi:hypothetical protein